MYTKAIASLLLVLYILSKVQQFVEWVRTERKKYRKRQRVTNRYLADPSRNNDTSYQSCKNKYPITFSPGNIYKGHQDYGVYYAVVMFIEFIIVAALVSYIAFMWL